VYLSTNIISVIKSVREGGKEGGGKAYSTLEVFENCVYYLSLNVIG
jgi:hypothetical protein